MWIPRNQRRSRVLFPRNLQFISIKINRHANEPGVWNSSIIINMHVLLFHSDYHNHDWNTFWLELLSTHSFARPAEKRSGQAKQKNFRRRPGSSSNFKCRQLPPTLCRQRLVSPLNAPPFHDFLQILGRVEYAWDVYTIFDTYFLFYTLCSQARIKWESKQTGASQRWGHQRHAHAGQPDPTDSALYGLNTRIAFDPAPKLGDEFDWGRHPFGLFEH